MSKKKLKKKKNFHEKKMKSYAKKLKKFKVDSRVIGFKLTKVDYKPKIIID